MALVKSPLMVMCAFLWIGFVCAISFMEAWLKFQAPGITVPLGLGIGRLVFGMLNKVEWVFAIAILAGMFSDNIQQVSYKVLFFFIPLAILAIQTIWLLPALDAQAALYISGKPVGASTYHLYFVAAEIVKVSCLLLFGIGQFRTTAHS